MAPNGAMQFNEFALKRNMRPEAIQVSVANDASPRHHRSSSGILVHDASSRINPLARYSA